MNKKTTKKLLHHDEGPGKTHIGSTNRKIPETLKKTIKSFDLEAQRIPETCKLIFNH